jgi:biotin operon repressor
MSMMMMVEAMKAKVGNPLRKLVLIKLADNANDLGECWPSHSHIADQCEISKASVKVHIKKLQEMGFLRVENRTNAGGKTSNLYHLSIADGASRWLGVGQEIAMGGSGDSYRGGSGDSYRISKSLEPVTESVIKPLSVKPEKKKVSTSRASRLTDEWQTPSDYIGWAKEQGVAELTARLEGEKFKDYWLSQAGQRGVKADWKATWRNWIRSSLARQQRPAISKKPSSLHNIGGITHSSTGL